MARPFLRSLVMTLTALVLVGGAMGGAARAQSRPPTPQPGCPSAPPARPPYPPGRCGSQVSATTIREGECVTFSGGGFRPGSTITITDNGAVVATVQADASGNFSVGVCPEGRGRHVLRAEGVDVLGVRLVLEEVVEVLGVRIAQTGSDLTIPAAVLGVALVAVGSGLVLLVRRRRVSAA